MIRYFSPLIVFLFGLLARPAFALNTGLVMDSDPGDYIGAGQNYYFTPANGTFIAGRNGDNSVSASFKNGSHDFFLDFAAPNNAPLTLGVYNNATRYPFQDPGVPGLSIYGDGRGCNDLTGSFEVREIAYGSGNTITSFDATFVQHCEGQEPALVGEILYFSNNPLPPVNHLTSPLTAFGTRNQLFQYQIRASNHPTSFTATGLPDGLSVNGGSGLISGTPVVEGKFPVALTATGASGTASGTLNITINPPGQSTGPYTALLMSSDPGDWVGGGQNYFFDRNDGTFFGSNSSSGYLQIDFESTNHFWDLLLQSPSGSTFGVGTYLNAMRFGSPSNPGIDIGGDGRGCNETVGSFDVKEITFMNGSLQSYRGTFVQHCEGGDPALRGEVWYNSTLAITSDHLPHATRGQPFSYQIIGNNEPTIFGASALPDGLVVNAATGVISGTPTMGGTFDVLISASNTGGAGGSSLTLTVYPPTPVITSEDHASAVPGQSFSFQVTADNQPTGFSMDGQPSGYTINATGGLLSGTTTSSGIYRITIRATNGSGTTFQDFTLTVGGTASPTPTQTPHTPTPTPHTPTPTPHSPTPTPTATATASGTPTASTRLLNIYTRLRVLTDDNALIGGFIVTGNAPKRVIVRAIGPSLTNFGVPGALADPALELHGPGGFSTIANDNWRDSQESEINATGLAPSDNLEAAIVVMLSPGAYTAVVRGNNGGTGIGLVEAYDLDSAAAGQLANISTRGFVDTGDNVMIGGFILSNGSANARVMIRAIGPSLTAFGVPNALADPILELHNNNGDIIAANDDWRDTQQAEIEATGIPPSDDRESAIVGTLLPGAYTAVIRGKNNTIGVALVEAYQLGGPATPTPTPTPTATITPSPTPSPIPANFTSLSSRAFVGTGDNVVINAFIISGSNTKQVIVRGIGPSLTGFGVPDALADPVLELHGGPGFVTVTNDNWRDTQEAEIQATGMAPTDNLEAAIVATLPPGSYTVVLRGKNNTSGVGLNELYDLSPSASSNLSAVGTRAQILTASNVLISGIAVPQSCDVVVRALGPSLAQGGISGALANPELELRDHNGALIRSNNDWQDDPAQAAIVSAAFLAPTDPLESAIAATLPPGSYTAIEAGVNNGTGIGEVQLYTLPHTGPGLP